MPDMFFLVTLPEKLHTAWYVLHPSSFQISLGRKGRFMLKIFSDWRSRNSIWGVALKYLL